MKVIKVHDVLSTNLRSGFNQVTTVEIEDKSFSEGAFGLVYICNTINGNHVSVPQVIKLFKETFPGSLEHNIRTIERLQVKLKEYDEIIFKQSGKTLLESFPAFKGIPQFSFKGILDGKPVIGFSADNLVSLGFKDFEKILEDPQSLNVYHSFPIEKKMLLAYQLASAFKVLEDILFIHADLKPAAIFVNLASCECAIIDYDSGVITENPNDEPNTWGAVGDWVAPEVWSQIDKAQRGDKIRVDLYTDRWSVAVGIHYLLSTVHPLFYLIELSPRIAKQYFQSIQWPNVDKKANYFQGKNEQQYDVYFKWLGDTVPIQIKDKLSQTINFGYRDPVKRVSYNEWKSALQSVQEPPKQRFWSNRTTVVIGLEVILSWDVENAHTIELITFDSLTGTEVARQNLLPKGTLSFKPIKAAKYRLISLGYFGQAPPEDIDIQIFPTPILERLIVPIPDFSSNLKLPQITLNSPSIHLPINFSYSNLPPAPTAFVKLNDDIRLAKPLYKMKSSFWGISNIFDRIKKLLSNT